MLPVRNQHHRLLAEQRQLQRLQQEKRRILEVAMIAAPLMMTSQECRGSGNQYQNLQNVNSFRFFSG